MSVQQLLNNLDLKSLTEGSQLKIDCLACGKQNHCYLDSSTGMYQCKVCSAAGNPYTLVKLCRPSIDPPAIFAILKEAGIDNDSHAPKPKGIAWLKDKLCKPNDTELQRLCDAKDLDIEALKLFGPCISKVEPIMYLPVFTKPTDELACGFLRVRLDGKLIKIGSGKMEKYPVIGSHGLFKTVNSSEQLLFVEGWRDLAAALQAGFNATASSGGASTWKDAWKPWFVAKKVAICMDADSAGNGGPLTMPDGKVNKLVGQAPRVAAAICTTVTEVRIVRLPFKMAEKHGKDVFDYFVE